MFRDDVQILMVRGIFGFICISYFIPFYQYDEAVIHHLYHRIFDLVYIVISFAFVD
jgi:hypothetical protein